MFQGRLLAFSYLDGLVTVQQDPPIAGWTASKCVHTSRHVGRWWPVHPAHSIALLVRACAEALMVCSSE